MEPHGLDSRTTESIETILVFVRWLVLVTTSLIA
jgi:hypothetical protein